MAYTGYTVRAVKISLNDDVLGVVKLADEDSATRFVKHFLGETTRSPERRNKQNVITMAAIETKGCANNEERLQLLSDFGIDVTDIPEGTDLLNAIEFEEGTERFDTIDVYFSNRRGKRIQALTERMAKGNVSPEDILKVQKELSGMSAEERNQFLRFMAGGK